MYWRCIQHVCCGNKGAVFSLVPVTALPQLQKHKTQPSSIKGKHCREFGTSLHVTCEMCCVHRPTEQFCSAAHLPGWVLDTGGLVLPRPMRDPSVLCSHVRCGWDVVTASSEVDGVACHAGGTMGSSGYPVVQVGSLELYPWKCPQTL
jgi:hypothetical protein